MNFLEAITHRITNRRANLTPLTFYKDSLVSDGAIERSAELVMIQFEVKLRAELTGPTDALPMLRERAARMFAHEVYGDVLHELRELRRELYTEGVYRFADDPVLVRLDALADRLKGEI